MTTYRLSRPDHTGNPARSENPGEYRLWQDALKAGVDLDGYSTREEAETAAGKIEEVSASPFAVIVRRADR